MKIQKNPPVARLLPLCAAILLAGCGGKETTDQPPTAPSPDPRASAPSHRVVSARNAPFYRASGNPRRPDGKLPRGTRLEVIDVQGKFYRVKPPTPDPNDPTASLFVLRKYLGPDQPAPAQTQTPAPTPQPAQEPAPAPVAAPPPPPAPAPAPPTPVPVPPAPPAPKGGDVVFPQFRP